MTKRKKIILISTAAAILLVVGIVLSHKKISAPPSLPPTLVELTPVKVTDIPLTATAAGTLIANQQTDISPKVGGYITKILFSEGDFVKAGATLIQLDNEKETNDLSAAKADAALSQLQYDHENKAFKRGLILQDQVYNAKVTNEKNEAIVQADQSALDDMTLTAPFSGYVGSKNVSVGDYVSPGQKLVTLVDQQHLLVKYTLASQLAPQLKVGQTATITASFLPGKTFTGQVNFVSPYIDPDSQTIEVHVVLDNAQGDFKPGEFVAITQTLGTLSHAILVPENSVFATMNDYHVFVVNNNHVKSIPVKTGEHIAGQVQIISGLTAKDAVISVGQDQVKDGDLIKVVTH